MADAYMCDQCGKYFTRKNAIDVPLRIVYEFDDYHEHYYDLCNDCIEDLRLFVEGSAIVKP